VSGYNVDPPLPTTFETGTEVAHYRLIAPLGAGGMGEVYKAHDSRLERTVALKILPPELVRNDERVRRFVQEAKSASSLNHPNIVTIHEIGQADVPSNDGSGASTSRPIHYIAMELIDGSTLRRKIHDEGTDLRTLLVYLAQAADGLAKAHAAGIVHRDLKPENIMVTRDGFAKVLDFGLAKLSVKKSSDSASEATAVRQQTREGAILGTVSYMSPEQVQGKPVDHRSDIFSFGCILYEAATRRRPFEADSDVDVMHQIIHDKPAPIDEINPTAPAELRRVIRRCMAKDPEKRYQSMKDLALELTEIVDEFEELSASASSTSGPSVSSEMLASIPQQRRTFRATLAAAGLVALIAVAFSIYQWRQARRRDAGAVSYSSMKISRLSSSGNVTEAAISPDGKYFAQVIRDGGGHWLLSVRQIATGSDVPLIPPSPSPIANLAFSRDGNYLYYTQREEESGARYSSLFQVAALGGAPRKITFDVDTRVTFSPDGKRLAFGRGIPPEGKNAIVVANADGTDQKELMRADRFGRGPTTASWSSDGTRIITSMRTLTGGLHSEVVEIDVGSGKVRTVSDDWRAITESILLPDDSGVLLAAAPLEGGLRPQIWLQPLPDGPPVRVTNDLNEYFVPALSSDGLTMTAVVGNPNADLFLSDPTDASGGTVLSAGTADQLPGNPEVAATGAVVYDLDRGQGPGIAIIDHPGAAPRLLTNDGLRPAISDDGKTIAYQSRRDKGVPSIFICDPDGANVLKIAAGARPELSSDGRLVTFGTPDGSLWKAAIPGGAPQKIADRIGAYAINRSSTQLAYAYWRLEGGRNTLRLIVVPLAGGPPVVDLPFPNSGIIRFTPKGDGVTFIRSVSGASNVFVQPLAGGPATQLTKFSKGVITGFDWTTDGKLVMTRGDMQSNAVLISNFR
jgi:serine/threonine protein kinase